MASRKRMNLTNTSLRSIKSLFLISHEKVDGGEAVQKMRMDTVLDGEVENEMKKITCYFYCVYSDWTVCLITVDNFLYCV